MPTPRNSSTTERTSDSRINGAIAAIQALLSDSSVPALAVGITDRESTRGIVMHGYSDLRSHTPLEADSRFAIGSISKSFTAAVLMQLMMEGRFDPNAPLTRYLPSLSLPSPISQMTGHHVLTHTAGLPSYLTDVASSRYVLQVLRDFSPTYAPGTHFSYSNTGYQLLGYVLENIEKLPYPMIMKRRIFQPLGMNSTCAAIDDAERARMVTSYTVWPYDRSYREAPWFEYLSGDGSIVSNLEDMCKYARFILNRGRVASETLLSEDAFNVLATPAVDSGLPAGHYGYGLLVKNEGERTIISHSGGIGGFHSWLESHMEDGLGVVLLGSGALSTELLESVTGAAIGTSKENNLRILPDVSPSPKFNLQNYVGVYRATGEHSGETVQTLEFAVESERLCLRVGDELFPLEQMGPHCFRVSGSNHYDFPFFFASGQEESTDRAMEVSHGAHWYTTDEFAGAVAPPVPEEYARYVGHYDGNSFEGPMLRIFVRNGRLWAMNLGMYVSDQSTPIPLEPREPGEFRFGDQPNNLEYVRFDDTNGGLVLRLTLSGTPLYRKDTP